MTNPYYWGVRAAQECKERFAPSSLTLCGGGYYSAHDQCREVSARESWLEGYDSVTNKKSDPVNNPAHYTSSEAKCSKCGAGIECIDVAETFGFNLGNTLKYIFRHGKKNDALEDLRKSAWYLNREIERLQKAK